MKVVKVINAALKASAMTDDVEETVDFVKDLVATVKDTDGFKAKVLAALEAIGAKEDEAKEFADKLLDLVNVFADTGITDDELEAIIDKLFDMGGTLVSLLDGTTSLTDALTEAADEVGVEDTTSTDTEESAE